MQSRVTHRTVRIANGTALSGAVATAGMDIIAMYLPTITSAAITFQCSADGSTFADLYNATGEVSYAASTGARWVQGVEFPKGTKSIKVRSGVTATPVNQGADRDIVLVLRQD